MVHLGVPTTPARVSYRFNRDEKKKRKERKNFGKTGGGMALGEEKKKSTTGVPRKTTAPRASVKPRDLKGKKPRKRGLFAGRASGVEIKWEAG